MYLDLMKRMFSRSIGTTSYLLGLSIFFFGLILYKLIRVGNVIANLGAHSYGLLSALTVNSPIVLAIALSTLAVSLFIDDRNSGLIEYLLGSGYMKEKIVTNYTIAVTIPSVILEGVESFVFALLMNKLNYFPLIFVNSLGLTWLIFSLSLYISYFQRTLVSSRITAGGYIGLLLFFIYFIVLQQYVRLANLIITVVGLSMFVSSVVLIILITRYMNTEKLLPP